MSPPSRGRPPRLPPPPAPRRASGARPIVRSRPRKPPRVEFLADELLLEEVDEFLPDEFVFEEPANESAIVFAGPSDAPPAGEVSRDNDRRALLLRVARPLRSRRPAALALGAAVGVALGTAVAVAHRTTTVGAPAGVAIAPVSSAEPTAPPLPAPASTVVAAASAGSASAPAAPPSDPQVAIDAKRAAQKALDRGQVSLAIETGQRAVDLDPTDAESWLILGAAYLQRGKYKDARRCFSECVEQATHGARSECRALLH